VTVVKDRVVYESDDEERKITLSFLIPIAAPTALQYPLLLYFSSSFMSVYKSSRVDMRNMKK
jgi:hypothetical protein